MKKLFLMTFVACFAIMFASCEKDVELNGTTWKAHENIKQQVSQMGDVNIDLNCTLNFKDATTGTINMIINSSVSVMGQEFPMPEQNNTESFTYTFDGKAGVLTSTDPTDTETIPFTYNKEDKTINIDINEKDEESGLDINFHLHFVQQ